MGQRGVHRTPLSLRRLLAGWRGARSRGAGVNSREAVVRCARAQLQDQYAWAHAGPDRFDCSGLTSYCYGQAGVNLSRSSYEQARMGRSVPRSQAQPGDILIYGGGSHVGLVTGPNEAIHALNPDLDIRVTKIDGANIGLPLTDVRSILPDTDMAPTIAEEPSGQQPGSSGASPGSEDGSSPSISTKRDRDRQRKRERDRARRRRRRG